jgi:hypothetical protein
MDEEEDVMELVDRSQFLDMQVVENKGEEEEERERGKMGRRVGEMHGFETTEQISQVTSTSHSQYSLHLVTLQIPKLTLGNQNLIKS